MSKDPRSEAEKARADLARNAEMGMAVPESPPEEGPSVTPETFADTSEAGRRRAQEAGIEAGGVAKSADEEGEDPDVLSRAGA
ncbi:hypothetical protein [Microvirga antarctica]|uniref:hypothetical protein n=1 Tax=Microvirga antarctica TaxID=2819233 RepID=UPI001B3183DC|nr:hypothetical protein [Microvirga antarctica]